MTKKEKEEILRQVARKLDSNKFMRQNDKEEAAMIVAEVLGFDSEFGLVKLGVAAMTAE